jgi:hypothetical protein
MKQSLAISSRSTAIPLLTIPLLLTACLASEEDVEASEREDAVAQHVQPLLPECGTASASCAATPWPNGRIPYVRVDQSWSTAEKQALTDAINEWNAKMGGVITFVPRTNEADHVRLIGGDGCHAPLGNVGGVQEASVQGCDVLHELGHIIGLAHENQRDDRDRYIQVREDMLCTPPTDNPFFSCTNAWCGLGGYEPYRQALIGDNVRKCTNSEYGPYDYTSVMHYASVDPIGCSAAAPSNCWMLKRNGTRVTGNTTVSAHDASNVIEMYREPNWRRFRPVFRSNPGASQPLDTRLTSTVTMTGSPALSRWGAGGVAAVARGQNGRYYVKLNSAGSQTWPTGSWTDLGGNLASDPAVVSWGSGRLDVVGVGGDGFLWHIAMNNNVWGAWGSIGRPGTVIPSAPAIASWGADRLDIFVRSGSNLFQKSWTTSGWSTWADRGCCFQGKPAAVSWGPNRIDVVGLASDGSVWHRAYNNGWGGSSWGNIGGVARLGTGPAIASRGIEHLNVYVTGQNGRLWHQSWGPTGWSGWADIGGIPNGSPAAATTASGRAHVVVNSHNGSFAGMWHGFWQ